MPYSGVYLGALHLTGTATAGYKVEMIAEGTDLGNPESTEVAVQSLLQDGDLVEHLRDGNRAQTVRIVLTGTAAQLQQGEADLMAELYKRNTLTVPPLLAGGATTVFDIVTSSLQQIPDDLAEVQRNQWHYSVRLVSLPFGCSATETSVAALATTGSTTTLVDNGSATTNWTGTTNGVPATVAVVSGAVGVTTASLQGVVTIALTRTASITTSSTKYLMVDWSAGGYPTLRAFGDGIELPQLAEAPSPTAGFTRTWFTVAAASIAVLRLDSTTVPAGTVGPIGPSQVRTLHIDNINRTDVQPFIGTARQLARSIDIGGSARGPGSISIEHATSALGDVIFYAYPDSEQSVGYSPPMRQYRVAGGATVTSDAAMVSGSKETWSSTGASFDIPITRLVPGLHLLIARARTSAGAVSPVLSWDSHARLASTNVLTVSGSLALPSSTNWANHMVARLMLPCLDMGTSGTVRIELGGSAFSGSVEFDEAWLLNTEIGQLTMISCGTSAPGIGAYNRLFLESATIDRPSPTIRVGLAADGSDSSYPPFFLTSWMEPVLSPPRVRLLTVTSNALNAETTLRHFRHWHTHAGS